jgi:hypothetical protein
MSDADAILASVLVLLQEETGKRCCEASPQRWDKASLNNMTTMSNICL